MSRGANCVKEGNPALHRSHAPACLVRLPNSSYIGQGAAQARRRPPPGTVGGKEREKARRGPGRRGTFELAACVSHPRPWRWPPERQSGHDGTARELDAVDRSDEICHSRPGAPGARTSDARLPSTRLLALGGIPAREQHDGAPYRRPRGLQTRPPARINDASDDVPPRRRRCPTQAQAARAKGEGLRSRGTGPGPRPSRRGHRGWHPAGSDTTPREPRWASDPAASEH
jgi:hypothetical protein